MERRIITVSELNEYIKMVLEHDELLMRIFVKGEISNFTNHYKTGHFYFSLKDEGGTVRAVMFRGSAARLKFMPENGMRVIVGGRVGVFPRDGQYQVYAETMEPDGIGALYIAYEQLKKKLEAEGLFDASKKKPLPKIPTRIGVITSPTGAAIRDIIHILGRRFPLARVILYPALVQGEGAAPDLVRGLDYFNQMGNVDVIIIGRGGGSLEDLWAFNDETLARHVAASRIPVISAVGHETDFTLCDFAASRRAPTPSAAAEIAVPETGELARKLANVTSRIELLLEGRLKLYRERLARAAGARVLKDPIYLIDDKRLALGMEERALFDRMGAVLTAKRADFEKDTAKLHALSPLAVLSRGYGAVFDAGGKVIRNAAETRPGERLSVMLSDGRIHTTVDEIVLKNKNEE
ncbi:MAG: exodeoxyribonuclease VII large subunit [Clostridiales bacterium]|nr:MAG: exodeoxyribonuclease VII large subunit [Clostridiales bacterium]